MSMFPAPTKSGPTLVRVVPKYKDSLDEFPKRLRTLRSQKGMSQVELAKLIKTTPRVYNRWEKGTAVPTVGFIVKLADTLQVSLDELVGRIEPKPPTFKVRNPKLHEMYRQIDQLSVEDQHVLVALLDSLLKRSQMSRILAG